MPVFHPFTVQHFIALAIGAVISAAVIIAGRKGGKPKRIAIGILTVLNLSAYVMVRLAWKGHADPGIDNMLPFQLCDLAAIIAGLALLTHRRTLRDLTYFWGLAATTQALLTPALQIGFPSWPFVVFFIQHFAIVATALFLPLADGWRPRTPWWSSPARAWMWANVYILCALGVNTWLGSNFGFASRKPSNPSLLDHLGPWPWYLLSLQGIAFLLFLLLSLPFLGRKPRGK
ncbi:TIGR02206 family membrane protein [Luteolibacter ambystomatis]|uniref:TIGR02206 family membrane protein n=1 Tax=Luteolibacter ambystomatis TaxID=2824561 RepID=A0A975J023_9BACT|nr:TIGR02206 family membrane protein [Luteolibacter ambystomatis]QUE51375.1 TIGR02206 family membrane protein [Luteolibacter ambystomatis]